MIVSQVRHLPATSVVCRIAPTGRTKSRNEADPNSELPQRNLSNRAKITIFTDKLLFE